MAAITLGFLQILNCESVRALSILAPKLKRAAKHSNTIASQCCNGPVGYWSEAILANARPSMGGQPPVGNQLDGITGALTRVPRVDFASSRRTEVTSSRLAD